MNNSSNPTLSSPLDRIWPPALVCLILWVLALTGERLTGAPLTEKLISLSDPSLLIVLAAALCFATGINFAFNANWSVRAFEAVFNMTLDAFILVWAASAFAALRLSLYGYSMLVIIVLTTPIALVLAWYLWRWVVTDLFNVIESKCVRAIAGMLIAFGGSGYLLYMA